MKRILLAFSLIFTLSSFLAAQQNTFFIDLAEKDIATFNDAITLIRLLYNEEDESSGFMENALWAASKKLFRVTIPIKPDTINPVITRQEFSYWVCRIYYGKKGLVKRSKFSRRFAFKSLVKLGIMRPGRGAYDTLSGRELLDTFAYLDYYIRSKDIVPKSGPLSLHQDGYESYPEWRRQLYLELDAQREEEKRIRIEKRLRRKEERLKRMEKEDTEVIIEG